MSFGLDLQSLAALIGDSHTTTNLNSILSSGHMFPVSVKWMDGDWVLYQVDASHQGALGQQVTSVNGFSMDQVQEKMAPLISATTRSSCAGSSPRCSAIRKSWSTADCSSPRRI